MRPPCGIGLQPLVPALPLLADQGVPPQQFRPRQFEAVAGAAADQVLDLVLRQLRHPLEQVAQGNEVAAAVALVQQRVERTAAHAVDLLQPDPHLPLLAGETRPGCG